MKKCASIFLALYMFTGSLLPGNSFLSFTELPALIEHYKYHRDVETPGISFISFLALHYDNYDHERSDQEHHSKLPLHHRVLNAAADQIAFFSGDEISVAVHFMTSAVTPLDGVLYIPLTGERGIFHPPQA